MHPYLASNEVNGYFTINLNQTHIKNWTIKSPLEHTRLIWAFTQLCYKDLYFHLGPFLPAATDEISCPQSFCPMGEKFA